MNKNLLYFYLLAFVIVIVLAIFAINIKETNKLEPAKIVLDNNGRTPQGSFEVFDNALIAHDWETARSLVTNEFWNSTIARGIKVEESLNVLGAIEHEEVNIIVEGLNDPYVVLYTYSNTTFKEGQSPFGIRERHTESRAYMIMEDGVWKLAKFERIV